MSERTELGDAGGETAASPPLDRVVSLGVPALLAVVTWLVALLSVGVVAGLGSPSILDLVALLILAALWWPIYRLRPWKRGMGDRVASWVEDNRGPLLAAGALLVARSLPFTPGLVVGVLDLPFRSASILFGATVFYRGHVGYGLGEFLLSFGQWYLEAYWLLVIGTFLAAFGRRIRRALGWDGTGASANDGGDDR